LFAQFLLVGGDFQIQTPSFHLLNQRPTMSPIGFIGIGIMGKGMLKNLATKLDATFVIWNRFAFFVDQSQFFC